MIPLAVLVVVTFTAWGLGALALPAADAWEASVRVGLAAMLAVTGSAHFGTRRADLVRMVPAALPRPRLLVTLTGVAEIGIGLALLFEETAPVAALLLIGLLVAMFPANIRAARERISIGGRPPMPVGPRAMVQALFIAAAWLVVAP